MKKESLKKKTERALIVQKRMNKHYAHATCALIYDNNPFHLLIATLLSAQTTDAAVNLVTPNLWEAYPKIKDLASARISDVENIIKRIGFYRVKAKNTIACAQMILGEFNGEVPRTIEELQTLPGVGRKTANVVLTEAFGIVCGIAVDTHVFRIAHKLYLSEADTPQKTEEDLLKVFPESLWGQINHQWVLFGREICNAKKPACHTCFLNDMCPTFSSKL